MYKEETMEANSLTSGTFLPTVLFPKMRQTLAIHPTLYFLH